MARQRKRYKVVYYVGTGERRREVIVARDLTKNRAWRLRDKMQKEDARTMGGRQFWVWDDNGEKEAQY